MQLGANIHSIFLIEALINYNIHTYIKIKKNSLYMLASFHIICRRTGIRGKRQIVKTEEGTVSSIHNYDALLRAMKTFWQM